MTIHAHNAHSYGRLIAYYERVMDGAGFNVAALLQSPARDLPEVLSALTQKAHNDADLAATIMSIVRDMVTPIPSTSMLPAEVSTAAVAYWRERAAFGGKA